MTPEILELIIEYLDPSLFILVLFAYIVGVFLKQGKFLSNRFIPVVLWGLSILMTILWFGVINGKGFTIALFIIGTVQGTLVAALAVFGNQVFKQLTKKKE